MTQPHMTVAIAILSDQLDALSGDRLPPTDGVIYQIFAQGLKKPVALKNTQGRTDIQLIPLHTRGVAHSRNAAIDAAVGDIVLFADGDLVFNTNAYAALRQHFDMDPAVDFLCGRMQTPGGTPLKRYPRHLAPATRLNTGKTGTPELAVRLRSARNAGLRFDTEFGAGAPQWLGDEYIFLCDAIRKGLKGRHVDLVLATHPADSSGRQNTAQSFEIREQVFRRAHGPASWPWRAAFAAKSYKRFPTWHSLWRFIRP